MDHLTADKELAFSFRVCGVQNKAKTRVNGHLFLGQKNN